MGLKLKVALLLVCSVSALALSELDKLLSCLAGDGHDDEGLPCINYPCYGTNCSHLCEHDWNRNFTVCDCPPGYRLDNVTCYDYNESADNQLTNVSSLKSLNLKESFMCQCFDGCRRNNDSCWMGPSPILYFTSLDRAIKGLNLKKRTFIEVAKSPFRRPSGKEIFMGLEIPAMSRQLYYFGTTNGSYGSVYRTQLDQNQGSSHVEVLHREDLKGIVGMSLDWLAGHAYLADVFYNRIVVCSLDSSLCATLHSNVTQPRGILTLPAKGKLFWTQCTDSGQNDSGIYQSGMDGANPIQLVGNLTWPNALTMDEQMNRLYWCDTHQGTVEYLDLDTGLRHLVFKDPKRQPYSLSVYEDSLYWCDWATGRIEECDKVTGRHLKPVLKLSVHQRFYSFTVFHPLKHKSSVKPHYNPCALKPCSHLCLLKAGALGYSCRCPDHLILINDAHTCIDPKKEHSLFLRNSATLLKKYINTLLINAWWNKSPANDESGSEE